MNVEGLRTRAALAAISDEGQFEELATAVLRMSRPLYAAMSHPGVNSAGRTRKSPVDTVCYAPDDPHHIIIGHHTISSVLRPKWLLDPATAKSTGRAKAPPVAGDVVKTIRRLEELREDDPNLRATLVLTSNREIEEPLMTEVVALADRHNLVVDFWPGSRIAHVLDTDPDGQWVRSTQLGIHQELLSSALLAKLSHEAVARYCAGDNIAKRVPRALDELLQMQPKPLTLVAAPSGHGKTVACHRALEQHVAAGGLGLIIDHGHLERSTSLDQAIQAALSDLEPRLSPTPNALSLATFENPLLILVEDVSRSSQPGKLLDKLLLWTTDDAETGKRRPGVFRILCPVWPHLLGLTIPSLEGRRDSATLNAPDLTKAEAAKAVRQAALVEGVPISATRAEAIAEALGNDPLLIGLNRDWTTPKPSDVIRRFVDAAVIRSAAGALTKSTTLSESLIGLGREMLVRRALNPTWPALQTWGLGAALLDDLSRLVDQGEILRLDTLGGQLRFRHDRVKAWMLTRAAEAMQIEGNLTEDLLSEPAYAEVMADLLVATPDVSRGPLIARLTELNPLALFAAIPRFGGEDASAAGGVAKACKAWLDRPQSRGPATAHLRWEAMFSLAPAQGPCIPDLIDSFPAPTAAASIAKLRSGDVEGGFDVCASRGLHAAVWWLPNVLEAATELRGKKSVISDISRAITESTPGSRRREAALMLAGVSGQPALCEALLAAWKAGDDQDECLREYLWAFARCATPATAKALLDPVCIRWAALPAPAHNDPRTNEQTIWDLAAYDVREGFNRLPPEGALDYFFQRAASEDLAWPIEYMLHGIDHPEVVKFITGVLARTREKSESAYATSGLRSLHWRGLHDDAWPPQSAMSRGALLEIWQDPASSAHMRIAAFDWWASSKDPRDLGLLRALEGDPVLAERALRNRLERGDSSAHPALVEKLSESDGERWWYYGRHSWSPLLSEAFEARLTRLSVQPGDLPNPNADLGYILVEIFLSIGRLEAEQRLLAHWDTLKSMPRSVLLALYIGTPELLRRASDAVAAHPSPKALFNHLSSTWGIQHNGHPGVTRVDQINAIVPYLHLLDEQELRQLSDCCDEQGWHDLRRKFFDPLVPFTHTARTIHEITMQFDEALTRKHPMDFDLDRAMKTGLSAPEIINAVAAWLPRQSSPDGLRVATDVVLHVGQRADVDLLRLWSGSDQTALADALADTRFAVARRTA